MCLSVVNLIAFILFCIGVIAEEKALTPFIFVPIGTIVYFAIIWDTKKEKTNDEG